MAIGGLPALTTWSVESENPTAFKTLITQEMLRRGFLAPPAFYASLAHTPEILDQTFSALNEVMGLVARCLSGEATVEDLLEGPICHTGFNRLN